MNLYTSVPIETDLEFLKEHLSDCTWLGKVEKIEKRSHLVKNDCTQDIQIHFSEMYNKDDFAFAFRNYPEKRPSLYISLNRKGTTFLCQFWM
jgi:hypothetical protein